NKTKYKFQYTYYDGVNFPKYNKKFNLITMNHVMQHIEDLIPVLENLEKMLDSNSLFIVKDHDASLEDMSKLIDIEHSLFELVVLQNDPKFLQSYFARYLTKLKIIRLMTRSGLIYLPLDEIGTDI